MIMTDSLLTLFCLADDESTSFPVDIEPTKIIGDLKGRIKTKKTPRFDDIDANKLVLWRVSIPLAPEKDSNKISLSGVTLKTSTKQTALLTFHTPVPARASTPLSDSKARQDTFPSGNLKVDIRSITDIFFAPGSDTTSFLGRFVRSLENLPSQPEMSLVCREFGFGTMNHKLTRAQACFSVTYLAPL
ncbi:hypothetical protein EC991_006760 [Linnemannia zychae]|nr:hypothetical protein EC991_006760 [Linnemannia zychae]